MKSVTFTIVLICCLSLGNVFAQGRSGARTGGAPEIPTRPEPATEHGNPQTSPSDHSANANGKSETAKAEGKKDAAQQLTANPDLTTKLKGLFPDNTDLEAKARGFNNLGQFVAAAHVSNNLGIPFDQLKVKMLTDKASLGDAIHTLKPELTASTVKAETKKAEDQAKKDTSGKG